MIQDVFKSSSPLPVKIISWIMLLGGISSLIMTTPALFTDFGKNGIVFGWGYFRILMDIGMIIVSFGISNMRRWALFALTGLTIIGAIASIYSFIAIPDINPNIKVITLINLGIDVLIMIYLWKISKMFK